MKRIVHSAGVLLYRLGGGHLEVLLVHPGGPFWAKKDFGAWSIPKGEYEDEDPMQAAVREFEEETGSLLDLSGSIYLGELKQPSGKIVSAWAVEGIFDPQKLSSNHFEMEWPPRSGKSQSFPEVDKAQWFGVSEASLKILKGQAPFINILVEALQSSGTTLVPEVVVEIAEQTSLFD